jgi:AsmA protein
MKRWRAIIVAGVVAVLAAAAAVPWLVPEAALRAALMERLAGATGLTASIGEPVKLVLFPLPALVAETVRVEAGPDRPPLLTASRIDGRLRLTSLLVGRVEADMVTVRDAQLFIGFDADGGPSWGTTSRRDMMAAGDLRFVDTVLTWTTKARPDARRILLSDVSLSWPDLQSAISVEGELAWNGDRIDLTARLADPAALLADGASPVRIKATSEKLRALLDGSVSLLGGARLDVDVGATSPSLRAALSWFGVPAGDGTGFAETELRARAAISPLAMSFSGVTIKLDGNEAEGAFAVDLAGERAQIRGTLAADSIDLTPYARGYGVSAPGGDDGWQNAAVDLSFLRRGDVDVRLSANEVQFAKGRLTRAALSVVARGGALELTLGEASLYGGTITGQLKIAPSGGSDVALTSRVELKDVDASDMLGGFLGLQRLDGRANGSLEVRGQGDTIASIIASLAGEGRLAANGGALLGIDLGDTLTRIQRRPLSTALAGRGGRTPFDTASASFLISEGVARSSDILLESPVVKVAMTGLANAATTSLSLAGTAAVFEPGGPRPDFALPFTVEGSWFSPVVEADPAVLIRQSGAAAPLLPGAVRQPAASTTP